MRRLHYNWRQLGGDVSGGIVAALIALPYGLAMASLMGLPPVLGVFTSILTAPITALLGSNPVLIGGTASATVPFIAAAVKQQGIGGAAKVSLVAAVFMMTFCVLRLGRHIQRVPHAVVSGFSCGIGGMMVISQIDGLASPPAMGIALLVIVSAALASRFSPRLPAPLMATVAAVLIARLLNLHVKEVGQLPLSMPPLAGFFWHPADVFGVLPQGFGLAFVTAVNLLITSRVVEHFRGRHEHAREGDADRELGAYGIANLCAGVFGAPMSVGIPARSLANVRCGATTAFSNITHAIVLLGILLLGSGFVARIPLAALGGITAWMGFCLLDWSTWRRLPKMRRVDAIAFLCTAILVLAWNAVAAVAVGCAVYGVRELMMRYSRPGTPLAAMSK